MTNPQYAADPSLSPTSAPRTGRNLASGIAVFLGGYLLLASLSSPLVTVAMGVFAGLAGRGAPSLPGGTAALLVLQFLFAILVIVAGLLLGTGPLVGKLVGAIIVVGGSLLTVTVTGLRLIGLLPIPGGREGIPFQAIFANSWFAIVLFVGVAWLLARRARRGWLALLATLILIPVPFSLALAGVEAGIQQIILLLLAAIIGVGIIVAGRPLRD